MGVRGVNLGNWLVLEKWMGDSPLASAEWAEDDYSLHQEYGDRPDELNERLERHYTEYVTRDDIIHLLEEGCDMVRVPFPYHVCGSAHHKSCSSHLNDLFDWCDELGMDVLLDLHTTQRSHNGTDCGGWIGMCSWHQSEDRVRRTLALLGRLVRRFAGRPSFWGIEPLNEPAVKAMIKTQQKKYGKWRPYETSISTSPTRKFLMQFYRDFYKDAHMVLGGRTRIVLHDHFFLPAWNNFLTFDDVVMDTHRYPAGKWFMRNKTFDEHLAYIDEIGNEIRDCSGYHQVITGEWSVECPIVGVKDLPYEKRIPYLRQYADREMRAWDNSLGGCFWSYKCTNDDWAKYGWSFEQGIRDGWLDFGRTH